MNERLSEKAQKIILYTDTPIAGGAENHMGLLAKKLVQDGYQTTLICSQGQSLDQWCQNLEKDHVPVIRLDVKHKHDPSHFFQLKKILRDEVPDILHLHLWNPGACRYAFLAADRKKTAIIATEHDPFPLNGIKKSIKKSTLARTDFTIAVSRDNEKKIISWYPQLEGKTAVIHNGIDLKKFSQSILHFSKQERGRIRSELFGTQPSDFVFLTIAALHPRKGLMDLLEAFAQVHQKYPQTLLVIVGEGPQKTALEKKIKKLNISGAVKMLNHQTQIPQILKSSDVFILPSVKEAFGLVLLEAMAAQTPVIATKVGGIPEIIKDRQSGWLVEPSDSSALSQKMIELMNNKPLREKLSFIGHHEVQKFDLHQMVKETEKVYDQALQLKKLEQGKRSLEEEIKS